jgi:hypothetical protein
MTKDIKFDEKYYKHLDFFLNASNLELEKGLVLVNNYERLDELSITDVDKSPLCRFHPQTFRLVVRDYHNFLGILGDHHVLIFGWTELQAPDTSEDKFIKVDCVVNFASYKYWLGIQVYFFADEKNIKYIKQVAQGS